MRSAADPSCNPTPHAGFSGGSLNWGMSFHVGTAQECCDACKAHARVCGAPGAGGRVYLNRSWDECFPMRFLVMKNTHSFHSLKQMLQYGSAF